MTQHNKTSLYTAIILAGSLLTGCGATSPTQQQTNNVKTLADLDTGTRGKEKKTAKPQKTQIQKKSDDEIRQLYRSYVSKAPTNDYSRQRALTRLAELELEMGNNLVKDGEENAETNAEIQQALSRTITLLEENLRDYPDAKGNDRIMYQLAQAYDQSDRYKDSLATLKMLTQKYPNSEYYTEAQFRIAEREFATGQYKIAQDAYSEVIQSPRGLKFHEKSYFKRGWCQYKLSQYDGALDDYMKAFNTHNFASEHGLEGSEKTQFDEYIRAFSLAFTQQEGNNSISQYFASYNQFKYLYNVYENVSQLYLQQERYTDAAEILEDYIQSHPLSANSPRAELTIISIWQSAGFAARLRNALESFYVHYNPDSEFWNTDAHKATKKIVDDKLKTYITQMASYSHEKYQKTNNAEAYQSAKKWYDRYLAHYSAYANKDKLYPIYAELLAKGGDKLMALKYFELAAFDGEIILDKNAAYSSLSIAYSFIENKAQPNPNDKWLAKYLEYSQRYVLLYPSEQRSEKVGVTSAQLAFKSAQYTKAIEFANFLPNTVSARSQFELTNIKARSYIELKQFADAESELTELLANPVEAKAKQQAEKSLALVIYRQAEQARDENQYDVAMNHFVRLGEVLPKSELASNSLYDAIALSINTEHWDQAVSLIQRFKQRYPKHQYTSDVTKKLSVAYLKSGQSEKAAQEFEKIANFENNIEVKRAALWQAAELYESKGKTTDAIRSYKLYVKTYKTPYEQNIEAMYKLTQLYHTAGAPEKKRYWQDQIQLADRKATEGNKTDRTQFITSSIILDLANQERKRFSRLRLTNPIAKSLKEKKTSMQSAVRLYGQAATFGFEEITTEATHEIGSIYQEFSVALLDSERPTNLNEDELEQYEILLEDQAFPFEEKAIEFYETNLSRTQDGIFNDWSEHSFTQLNKLFPVRYSRKGKTEIYKGNR